MSNREVMQQALEALEHCCFSDALVTDKDVAADAILAIKQELAQPEQEPVAWLKEDWTGGHLNYESVYEGAFAAFPVYKHPPAAQPEQEPCIGKDPRCPCQDGDACHYKDCGGTKARTVAQPVQEPVVSLPYHPCTQILIAGLKDLHAWDVLHEWDKARKIVDDGMVATTPPAAQRKWVGLTDEEVSELSLSRRYLVREVESKLKERNT